VEGQSLRLPQPVPAGESGTPRREACGVPQPNPDRKRVCRSPAIACVATGGSWARWLTDRAGRAETRWSWGKRRSADSGSRGPTCAAGHACYGQLGEHAAIPVPKVSLTMRAGAGGWTHGAISPKPAPEFPPVGRGVPTVPTLASSDWLSLKQSVRYRRTVNAKSFGVLSQEVLLTRPGLTAHTAPASGVERCVPVLDVGRNPQRDRLSVFRWSKRSARTPFPCP